MSSGARTQIEVARSVGTVDVEGNGDGPGVGELLG